MGAGSAPLEFMFDVAHQSQISSGTSTAAQLSSVASLRCSVNVPRALPQVPLREF